MAPKSNQLKEGIQKFFDMIEHFGKVIKGEPIDRQKELISYFLEKSCCR